VGLGPRRQYKDRLPRTVEAILDGEFVLIDPRGAAHFYRLMAQMRTSHPDESQLMFLVFDLLHQYGVELCGLPFSERKRDLNRRCRKSKAPFLKQVQNFPNGAVLFDHCSRRPRNGNQIGYRLHVARIPHQGSSDASGVGMMLSIALGFLRACFESQQRSF
jgi:ATP dependent DNA ligase domain